MIMNDIFFALFYIAYMLLILSAVVYVVLDNRNPVKILLSWEKQQKRETDKQERIFQAGKASYG